MLKTKLKNKPKASIQKKKISITNNIKKLNSKSTEKFIISKSKELATGYSNLSSMRSKIKSSISNKKNRSREKSNEKNAKELEKNIKNRNKNLNNSNKIKIKKNKENSKFNSNFLNRKRKKENKINFEDKNYESEEDFEEEQEKDEESIKSFSEARLEYLPCRKEEQDLIYNYIKQGLQTNGNYHSLYIAGMPGTGKTASVKTIINILESELNEAKNKRNGKALGKDGIIPFKTIFLSGINFPNISNVFKIIYKFIFAKVKDKLNIKDYIQLLNEF